jgi:hypothetical protein
MTSRPIAGGIESMSKDMQLPANSQTNSESCYPLSTIIRWAHVRRRVAMKTPSRFIKYGIIHSGAVMMLVLPGSGKDASGTKACTQVRPGSYIVLGYGVVNDLPAARVLKERWLADGSIEGERVNRDGDKMLESDYIGHWEQLPSCDVIVHRINGRRMSKTRDIVDMQGHASRAISITPGTALKKRYWLNPIDNCTESKLEGQWLGGFSGKVFKNKQWLPYEAVGKLSIRRPSLEGLLLSSKAGVPEATRMEGVALLHQNCFGILQWRDQQGRSHADRILISGDGGLAILLRTDPGLFSIGVIRKEK